MDVMDGSGGKVGVSNAPWVGVSVATGVDVMMIVGLLIRTGVALGVDAGLATQPARIGKSSRLKNLRA